MVRKRNEGKRLILWAEEEPILYQKKMTEVVEEILPLCWTQERAVIEKPTDGQALSTWLKQERQIGELGELLQAFRKFYDRLEAYLLDDDHLLWDPQWIFWCEKRQTLKMVYIPWRTQRGQRDIWKSLARLFWEYAVQNEWQDENGILFLYRFLCQSQKKRSGEEWKSWLVQEQKRRSRCEKAEEEAKKQALDILMATDEERSKRWWQRWKRKGRTIS